MNEWDEKTPIYLQLRGTVVARILNGSLAEGEPIPSVRQVAAQEKINPLTVSKAYQMLVDEGLLEKKRGIGMYVRIGAQASALEQERAAFLSDEWPQIQKRIEDLHFDVDTLLREVAAGESS